MFKLCALLAMLTALAGIVENAVAHSCPPGASAAGIGITSGATRANGTTIGAGRVAPCETIFFHLLVIYLPVDPVSGERTAAFSGGSMLISVGGLPAVDVTPQGGVPTVGPPECGGTEVAFSHRLEYVVREADVARGRIDVTFLYANGNSHAGEGDLSGVVRASTGMVVAVGSLPTCTISPVTNVVCAGATAVFHASATNGGGPYTFVWAGPNGFTATTDSIALIPNADNAGVYRATVTDAYGCTSACEAHLLVGSNPTFSVAPVPDIILGECAELAITPASGEPPYVVTLSDLGGPIQTNVALVGTSFTVCPRDIGRNIFLVSIEDAAGCSSSVLATGFEVLDSRLNMIPNGTMLTLAWRRDAPLLLEQANNLAGPWTQSQSQSNPQDVAIATGSTFFRLSKR